MIEKNYVFDTYALIEIIKGNKNYNLYLNSKIIITNFILAELCFNLIRELGVERGSYYTDEYSKFIIDIDKGVIKKAMIFRLENIKRNMSITDCIGYFLAKELNIKFLTGDKEFKDMDNAEFVK